MNNSLQLNSAIDQNESSIWIMSARNCSSSDRRYKMIKLTKNVIGAGAAAAALVGMSVPAQARDYNRNGDGISAGEVISGAVILGGIAAVLSSKNNDRYDDRDYGNRDNDYRGGGYDDRSYGYDRRGGSRAAINQCVRDVEGYSNRNNRAKVTEIRDIQRTRDGYKVSGKIVVRDGYRGNDRYNNYNRDNRYDRGDNYGRYNRGYESGYDKGRFTCYVERGRVVDIDYKGLDQWR
jgi:hypothetical protein